MDQELNNVETVEEEKVTAEPTKEQPNDKKYSDAEVDEIIANDPFYKKGIASYNVIEFNPVLNSVDNFIKALGK